MPLRLEGCSNRSINDHQLLCQHHSLPCPRPPCRLLQLPAIALVRDPFLRDRGDLPYPAAPLGDDSPCQTSLTYFCNFPNRCRTLSILPAFPSINRPSAIGLLLVPMTTTQATARLVGRGPAALRASYDSTAPRHRSDSAHRHFQDFCCRDTESRPPAPGRRPTNPLPGWARRRNDVILPLMFVRGRFGYKYRTGPLSLPLSCNAAGPVSGHA